jgi:hypothetical protein
MLVPAGYGFAREGCGMSKILKLLLTCIALTLPTVAVGALYGNDTAANARPLMADGTAYVDQISPTSLDAWFTFRVDPYQSYSIEQWSPYGQFSDTDNARYFFELWETDLSTIIGTADRSLDFPSPQLEIGFPHRGDRRTFMTIGTSRRLVLRITWLDSSAPSAPRDFTLRIVPTTLAAARWSVNGYNDFFALSNISSGDDSSAIQGQLLYFDESGNQVGHDWFTLGPNASTQIVKPNGVPIGGAIRGGVRIVHDGAPGALLAHQTWFNPVTGQFVVYPFTPLVHAYSRGGM